MFDVCTSGTLAISDDRARRRDLVEAMYVPAVRAIAASLQMPATASLRPS